MVSNVHRKTAYLCTWQQVLRVQVQVQVLRLQVRVQVLRLQVQVQSTASVHLYVVVTSGRKKGLIEWYICLSRF